MSSDSVGGQRSWLDPRSLFGADAKPGRSPCESHQFDTPTPEPLGDQLKDLFANIADDPMPKRLVDLADALEAAFQKGELHNKVRL